MAVRCRLSSSLRKLDPYHGRNQPWSAATGNPFSPSDSVRVYIGEILLSLKPRLRQTAHTVSVDCPDDLEIDSYPGALSQVLTNFVMNSLVHGFAEGQVGFITISAQ